jgi:hypothetical protein
VLPRILHKYESGELKEQESFNLFSPRAQDLAKTDAHFHLMQYSVLDRSPLRPVNMVRAMNVLNVMYFSKEQMLTAFRNIYDALEEGGFFISGSNFYSGSVVDGGIYRKNGARLETVWNSGKGHPFQETLAKFNEQNKP